VELALKLRQGARQLHEQHVPTQDFFFFDGDLVAAIGSFWDGIETFTGGFRAHNNLGYLMTSQINFRSTGTFVRANPTQKKEQTGHGAHGEYINFISKTMSL